jgi:L-ascorbate metabolism protein UlaG (beta-lactamase superfamily)
MEQFGGRVRKQDLIKFERSKNWKNGKFENLIETKMEVTLSKLPKLLKDNIKGRKTRAPERAVEILPFNASEFEQISDAPKCIWFGHSALLLRMDGMNILIDPMLGPDASPIAPISTKRFSPNSLDVIDNLPNIDLVLMTHDHYDHLDLASIKKLMPKVESWIVGLGISRHLEKWGVSAKNITELDWWDTTELKGIQFTYTPSRHFSGRGVTDRAKSLWGGWAIKGMEKKIYWSGDGGYGPHFKEIGEKLGPFDWGFMECGQYNENWHAIHMYPEESVQAAIDAKVNITTPVHWGAFSLALHHWKEPVERYMAQAERLEVQVRTPRIGEIMKLNDKNETYSWWNEID